MARVQYRVVPIGNTVVTPTVHVPHYYAKIRERPGAGYAARLLKKMLHLSVEKHGSQRKAAEALGISLGKLQRELKKAA